MGKTTISWTNRTWNPLRGCAIKSAGCFSCYAMMIAARFSGPGQAFEGLARMTPKGPQWTGEIRTLPEKLEEPLHWRQPSRVFVNSMSDLFHEKVPTQFIADAFGVMARAPQHEFQILTKRPERMADVLLDGAFKTMPMSLGLSVDRPAPAQWPLANVIVGTSIEDQRVIDRLEPVVQLGAAGWRTMLSLEPLIGPIDFEGALLYEWSEDHGGAVGDFTKAAVDWVIVGGESRQRGREVRPAQLEWFRSLRDQAKDAGAAFFMKQLGTALAEELGCTDSKGEAFEELPADLRIREFPGSPVFPESPTPGVLA